MNRFKIAALLKEFPFLELFKKVWEADSIRISRVDRNLLLRKGRESSYECCIGSQEDWDIFSLVFLKEKGKYEIHGVAPEGDYKHGAQHVPDTSSVGETILEAIDEFPPEDIEKIVAIVEYNGSYDDFCNYGDPQREWVIYKPSRSSSFQEELQKARQEAERSVRGEIETALD